MGAARATGNAGRIYSPMPRWLRVFLILNVVQDFAIGVTGLFAPAHIVIPLKGLSPLNARFIASLYVGGGVIIIAVALTHWSADARIGLCCLSVITILVLVMTFVYWNEFTVERTPWLWLVTYILDPIVAPFALVALRIIRPAETGRHRLTPLFAAQAVVFGAIGVALLVAPSWVLDAWPWTLTPIIARVYAAFFLAFATGAALAAGERRVAAVRPFLVGSVALLMFTLAATLVHPHRIEAGPARWLWFSAHAGGITLFTLALVGSARDGRRLGALAPAAPGSGPG